MIQISMFALRIRAALSLALSSTYFLFVVVPDFSTYTLADDFAWLSVPLSFFGFTFIASLWCLVRKVRSEWTRQILAGAFEGVILFSCFVLFMYLKEKPWRRTDGVFKFIWLYASLFSLGYPALAIGAGIRGTIYGIVKLYKRNRTAPRM